MPRPRSLEKYLLAAVGLLVAGCTTVENDAATNYRLPFLRTQIDFQPPDRKERMLLIERETKSFAEKKEEMEEGLAALEAEREILYAELSDLFPDCRRQRHCLASVAKGGRKRFDRYDEIRNRFNEIDAKGISLQADLELWRRRHDLRVRAIYNRYLVHEMLSARHWDKSIRQILVHSLETFPNRRSLSERLIRIADPEILPTVVGDLDFRMMGRPVDESAVLATFDIWLHENYRRTNEPVRFMVTFLVNSYQLDPQFYEAQFLKVWAYLLSDKGKASLREEAFCGIHSIASPMLLAKMNPAKLKPCAPARARMEAESARFFDHRFKPDTWLLPVGYAKVFEAKDLR